MKKITTGILATLACLACLSGCSGKGNDKDPTGIEASVALEGAKAFLEAKYKKQVSEVSANYELPNTVAYDGVTYELSWSVDVDKDVIVERDDEEGITYINVNESAAEDVKYVLTGTIKDADGNELKVEFKCKLLQGPTTAAVRIIEAPVVGTAYKLYVYQGANGAHIYANGKMKNTYYFDTTDVVEEGIDVYVEAVEGKEGKFYLYHNVVEGEGEEATTTKMYINIVKSGTHTNAKYETTATTEWDFNSDYKTMTTDLDGTTFYLGCDGTYNTIEPQKEKGEGYYTAYLSGIVEKTKVTDDIKLETAFNTLTMAAAYVDEFDTALPTQDPTFTDVKINWECDSDKVTLGKNINDTQKTTFKAGSATDTIVLKAVMTCGEEKATKEFNVKLVPNDGEAIAAAALELKAGESFGNEATLTGMVTKLNRTGLAEYGNIEATMAANGDITTLINCYQLVGITDYQAKDVDYGYNVTVKGILTNYNGTIQFGKGCEIVSFTAGSRNDIPGIKTTPADIVDAAYALEDGKSMYVDYTLTGVITKVDTVYSADNKNISVIIAVEGKEDKPILCYRMKGEGANVIKVGDTITVTGTLKNHKGTIEFDTGCRLDSYVVGEGGGEVDPPAGGDETKTDPLASKVVTSPAANVAYNFYMYQGKADKVVYISGGMAQTYYLATSADASAALSIYLEETTGGYYMYCYVNEVKTYINMVESGTHVNGVYDTTASTVYTFNTEYNTLVNANGYYFGTRSDKDYTTMGPCAPDTIETNFVAHFIEDETSGEGGSGEVTPPAGGEGGDEGGSEVTPPASTADFALNITSLNIPTAYSNDTITATVNDVDFSYIQIADYGKGMQFRSKNGVSSTLWNATALNGNLTKIVFTPNSNYGNYTNAYTLALGNTAECNEKTVNFNTTGNGQITTVEIEGDYTFFKITHANLNTQYFDSIEIFTEEAAPKYALTLRDGNPMMGGYSESFEYEEGAALELPARTAEGKTFKGWFGMDDNGDLTVAAPTTMPAEAIALFAVWDVIPYTLTIKQADVEDKTFTFGVEYTNDILISVNDLAYVLEENLPEGYKWEENVPETFELKDYTFTAISAEVPKYTLTLRNGNPMMGGTTEILEYVEGAALELPALTADGKNFLGWYSMDDNGDLVVAAPATMPAESIALFAKWEVIPYTLTIVQDGQEDKTFTFGVEYADGIDISVNDLAYVLEENLPAEAVWVETIPSTFELKDYTFTAKVIETLSIEEALTLGKTFSHDAYSTEKYYISGIITSITNTTYGNCYINDVSGNSILVYGINDANGARYDAMTTKPVVGDTVKLLSVVGCYSGAAQLKSATLVEISATEDADKVAIEKAALEFSESVKGGMTIDLATAGKSFSNVAIAWEVTAGNDIASIADNALLLMNPDVDTTITLAATISCGEASATKEFTVAVAHKDESSTAPAELAVFEFGANGSAHVDGNDIGTSKTYTENGYTLALTNVSKVYDGAYDAKGNSCIKFGTSSKTGSMTFTVPADVTSVVIKVAKYKTNTTKINVNGTAYTLTKNSNDGAYDEIIVDTSSTKTVSFATVSGGVRCMVNSITFIG